MTMSKRNGIILKMWLNKLMGKQNQAQILEKSNLFKKFGGGGIGILYGFHHTLI